MNRRQFFKSSAGFAGVLAVAPSIALALPTNTVAPSYINTLAGCPGYAAILASMCVTYKDCFGHRVRADSAAHQLLSALAYQQCETLCAINAMYSSFNPATATGLQLDSLARLNYKTRKLGETDADLRDRMFS